MFVYKMSIDVEEIDHEKMREELEVDEIYIFTRKMPVLYFLKSNFFLCVVEKTRGMREKGKKGGDGPPIGIHIPIIDRRHWFE